MKTKPPVKCFALSLVLGRLLAAGPAMADDKPALSFELVGGTNPTTTIVFSRDSKWLSAYRPSGEVEIWDVGTGVRAAQWQTAPAAGGPISIIRQQAPMAFLPEATQLLVATGTNVAIRESLTGKLIRTLESPPSEVGTVTLSLGGNRAVGLFEQSRQLVFWNLVDGKTITRLTTERYPWESGMRVGTMPRMLPISMSAGFCRALSPNGVRFAVGRESAQVDIWNLAGGNYSHYLGTVSGPDRYGMSTSGRAEALAFLDNERLAVVYNRERLSMLTLNTNDAEVLQTLPRMTFTAKTPDGNMVTGELVAQGKNQATVQIQRLGLTPVTLEVASAGIKNYLYQVTNTIDRQVVGRVTATNRADASAQFEKRFLKNGRVVEAPDDVVTVESRKRAAQETLKQHPDWALLRKTDTLISSPGFEIRSLAVSGDGRRLAVAGMRMAWRKGVFAPAGDGVYDAPVNAELQVWNASEMKLLTTIKGRADEKFVQVALDETGGRIVAVTSGVTYNSRMSGAQQQGLELSPTSPRRVYVWEVPSDKTESK